MSASATLARSYSRALLEVLPQNGDLDSTTRSYARSLRDFAAIVETNKQLRVALFSAVVAGKEKSAIVEELSQTLGWDRALKQFLFLLAGKNRLSLVREISVALARERMEKNGGTLGLIESADQLPESEVKALEAIFSKKLNKPVEFEVGTDGNLLAGLRVSVNGVTYDGTLRSQLEHLRERLVTGVTSVQ